MYSAAAAGIGAWPCISCDRVVSMSSSAAFVSASAYWNCVRTCLTWIIRNAMGNGDGDGDGDGGGGGGGDGNGDGDGGGGNDGLAD